MRRAIAQVKKNTKRLSKGKIKDAKVSLRRLYALEKKNGGTWRTLAATYYPEIPFQVLQAFADHKRQYIPRKDEAREALDLYMTPNPYRTLPRWYKRTPEALAFVNRKREQIKHMQDEAKAQRNSL